jgi:hypothetical protein
LKFSAGSNTHFVDAVSTFVSPRSVPSARVTYPSCLRIPTAQRVRNASATGTSTATKPSIKLSAPVPARIVPPNSSPGSVVVMSTAPPIVLRPNKVPCGPRSTCTFAMSRSVIVPPTALPMYTSSM